MAKVEDLSTGLKQRWTGLKRDASWWKKGFVILPTTWYYMVWEGFMAFTCLLTTVFVSFQKAYKSDEYALVTMLHAFDFLYLVHVGIKFNLGYVTKKGTLILDKRKIKEHYLKTTFIFDFASLVKLPLEMIGYAVDVGLDYKQVVRGLNLLKILRFYTLTSCFGTHEDQLGISTKAVRTIKYLLIAFLLIHFASCGWYILACPNEADVTGVFKCYSCGWAVIKNQHMEKLTTLQRYIKCLYWATITATSTGYGDIHAVTPAEKWYSVCTMLLGIGFFFGPILGYMASTLTNSESKRAKYAHKMLVIGDHLNDKTVSMETQRKVRGYYEYLWTRHQGAVNKDMFADLPMTFQAEISLAQNKHVLERAPLFQMMNLECLRMVTIAIQPVSYLPKQIIFWKNDIKHTLFYIKKGSVEILDDNNKPTKLLREGSFFGEVSLLLNMPKCATVRALSYCELLTLERSNLTKILKHFPKVNDRLMVIMQRRCEEAAIHVEKKKSEKNKGEPTAKRFTIDKAVITLTDFTEGDDTEGGSLFKRAIGFVFHPEDKFLKRWKIFITLWAVFQCFFQTYVCAFTTSFGNWGYGSSDLMCWLFGYLYFIDFLYLVDILIQTRTAVLDDSARGICSDTKVLLKNYLKKGSMLLDVMTVFPLEIFSFAAENTGDVWVLATLLRCNRLIKTYKLFELLSDLKSDIHINITKIHALKLVFVISFITHVCGCVWYFQACFGETCDPESWATHRSINNQTNAFDVYISSIYWAASTMTSTGYGDITARSTRGEFIVLFVLIIGLLMYGFCLSTITAILTTKLSAKVEFTGRILGVTSFMNEQNLSHALIERVERYLGLVWRIHQGQAIPGAELLMGDLPLRLQEEVAFEEMQKIITKVPIFMDTDASFLRQLTAKLITYVFMPGDTIVYKADVGREMYIMRRGLVEVLSKDDQIIATLGPGGYFGEVGLIFGEPRTADVRAKTFCELAMLRKSDLDEVLINFPLIEKQLQATGSNLNVLAKIKEALTTEASPRKASRIDIIDKTRKLRRNSVFRRQSVLAKLTEEEVIVNDELNLEFWEPYTTLHPVLRYLSYLLVRNTISPNSYVFTTWTTFTVAMSCIHLATLGLQTAFIADSKLLIALNYIIDVLFLIDIYIKMHVSYYNEDGVLVTHPTATAKNYLRRNFLIDLLAVIPFDLFLLDKHNVIYSIGKLNRFLRLISVSNYFRYLDTPIQSGNTSFIRAIKFGTYMYLLTHFFACLWFMVACPKDIIVYSFSNDSIDSINSSLSSNNSELHHDDEHDEHHEDCRMDSWALHEGRDLDHATVSFQYITSMYWAAATTCSVGYGDIHAHLTEEMVLALVCMVVGVVFYGYIIASSAASLANADVQRSRYQQKLDTINRFLQEQRVKSDLVKRVKGFYEFLWHRNKGVDLENLFQGLPISLQADITLSLYKDIIESVPLFQGTELGFTKMLSLYIRPLLVPKGEYIVRKGDIGEEMFFINKGAVEVVSEHDNPIIFDTMTPGRFFGEISTIFKCPRTASIRTQTNVEMFVLKKKDLDVVLSHYPQIRKKIIETAEERQRMVAERAAAFVKKKKEEEEAEKRKKEGNSEDANTVGADGDDNSADFQLDDDSESGDTEVLIIPSFRARLTSWLEEKRVMLKAKSSFVIPIHSRWGLLVNGNCFLIVLTFISTTYMATYQHHPLGLVLFNIFAEFFFYFEIYLNFHVAFMTKIGNEENEYDQIYQHYLKGRFRFDAVVNFPLQLFCVFAASGDRMTCYSYLNLLHLLRVKRLNDWFKERLKRLNINLLLIRLSENLTQIIIGLQTFACIWYFTACPGNVCRKGTWVTKRHLDHDATYVFTPTENYGDCVYWALATMTSAGYGDIHATNTVEKVLATVVMIFGKLLFGFVLGNVSSAMASAEMQRVLFEERFTSIQTHMKDQRLSLDIQHRVFNFYQYIWRRNRGTINDDIFSDLPSCLNAELCLELTGDYVKNVPYLKDCEFAFIRLLSTKTQLIQFHKDEYVTRKGDIGTEMYFIKSGEVDLFSDEDGVVVITLKEGDFFSEESLLGNCTRKYCTRAVTHVDLFCLRNADLKLAFQVFPEEEKRVLSHV